MKNTILNGGLTSFGGMKTQSFQTLARAWKNVGLTVVAGTLALTGNTLAAAPVAPDTVLTVTNGTIDLTNNADYFTVVTNGAGVQFNTPNTLAASGAAPVVLSATTDILFGGTDAPTVAGDPTTAILLTGVVDQNSLPVYNPATFTIDSSGTIGSINDTDPSLAPIIITDNGAAAAVLTINPTNNNTSTGAAAGDLIFVAAGSQLAFTPFTAPGTVANPLSLVFGEAGNIDSKGTLAIGTGLTITPATTLIFTGGGVTTISGNIAATTGALTINAGTLTLSGANSFTGNTLLNGAALNINSATALGTGTFILNGGTIDNTSGAAVTDTANNPITISNNLIFTGSNNLNLGTGAVTLTASIGLTVTANTLTIGGAISGGGDTLFKLGKGTLALTGVSTYSGGTADYGGTIDLGSGGTTGSLAGGLIMGNASFNYTVNTGAPVTQAFTGTTIVSGESFVNSVNATDTLALGGVATFNAAGNGGLIDYQPLTTDLGAITTSTDTATAGTSAATSILATNESIGSGTTLAYAQSGTAGTNAITAYTAAAAFPVTGGTAAFNYKLATNGTTTLTAAESANTLQFTGTAAQTVAATVPADTLTVNGLMNSGTGGVTITAPVIIGANNQLVIISNTSNTTISSVISQGATASVVYGGVSPGTLTLTGVNTYTGGTFLNGGTVSIGGAAGGLIQPLGVTNGMTTGFVNIGTSSTLTTDGAFSYTLANPISLQTPFTGNATTLTVNVPFEATPVTLTLTGQISGAGGIIVNATGGGGTGTLILSNANNFYSGPTSVQFGTLQAGSAGGFSPASDFALLGPSTLDLNGFSETISSLNGVAGTTVTNSSAVPASPSTLTIGGGSGAPPAVSTFSGNLTNGATNTLALVLNSAGGTTLILNGAASTYSGGTTITNGTLAVGSLTALGTGTVSNNSTLETTATTTLGSAAQTINVNAAYSQNGNLLLQVVTNEGAAPQSQASAGVAYDTLAALGTIGSSLGGAAITTASTIKLNFEATALPGQRFQVASSAAAPIATPANPVLPLAVTTTGNINPLIIPITSYNDSFNGTFAANNIVVTLFQPYTTFAGLTANQANVATNLDNIVTNLFGFNFVTSAPYITSNGVINSNSSLPLPPVGTPVRDFFDNITEGVSLAAAQGNLGAALDQLSPQRFELLHNVAFDNYAFDIQSLDNEFARERMGFGGVDTSGFTFNNSQLGPELSQVQSRLLAWSPAPEPGLLSDSSQSVLGGVSMVDKKEMKPMAPENLWNVFIDGGVDLGDKNGNTDLTHSSYTTGRVRVGFDYHVCTDLSVGALFGYNHTDADLDNEGSKAHVDSYTPGVFLTYADKDGFYANGLFTYTANEYNTARDIVIPGVNRTANGSSSGNQFAGDLDGGYDFHRGDWTFGPSAGLTYVNLGIDSFTETGAGAANLAVNSQSTDSLRSRLGVTVSYRTEIGSVVLTPYASAYWQHEFLDNGTNITSSFVGLPGGTFSVQTTAGDSDNGLFGAGLNAELNQTVTLFIDYGAEAGGSTFFGQSATGGVKISF